MAEGADRVINVATEGVERGWNVERFTSGREYLSILLGVGYFIHQWLSACAVVIIKFCEHDNISQLRARSC